MPVQQAAKTSATLGLLNAVPNVLWTVLCVAPIYIFCTRYLPHSWLYAAAVVAALPLVLPFAALQRLQLSTSPATYRKLGVPLVNQLSQGGLLVKQIARSLQLDVRHTLTATDRAALIRTTYTRERFHLSAFLFFLFPTLYAAIQYQPAWLFILLLSNVIYNVYPVWLQQYLRLRLTRIRHFNTHAARASSN